MIKFSAYISLETEPKVTLAIDCLFHRPAILYGLYNMFPFALKASRLKNVKFADIEVYPVNWASDTARENRNGSATVN